MLYLATKHISLKSVMIRPMHATFKDCWWCLQELAAIRDALTPPLACAAAKIGDIEALEALKEMVSHPTVYTTHTVSTIENGTRV